MNTQTKLQYGKPNQALGTQVRLRNSHNLLYVIKETHFFPSLNSSLMTRC